MNPDGKPDQSFVFGDADNDSVIDRVIPEALAPTVLNFSTLPPSPYLAYKLTLNQGTLRYSFIPTGSRVVQVITYSLLWLLPVLSATLGIWFYVSATSRLCVASTYVFDRWVPSTGLESIRLASQKMLFLGCLPFSRIGGQAFILLTMLIRTSSLVLYIHETSLARLRE